MHVYKLRSPWSAVPEKPRDPQLLRNSAPFMEPGRFIIMFTRIHHWSKSEALNGKVMRYQYEGCTEQGYMLETFCLSRQNVPAALVFSPGQWTLRSLASAVKAAWA
jgi:hypothetical protein